MNNEQSRPGKILRLKERNLKVNWRNIPLYDSVTTFPNVQSLIMLFVVKKCYILTSILKIKCQHEEGLLIRDDKL